MDEQEKAKLGAATLKNFFHQFGNDIYAKIFLEILFEGLLNAETLFVFGEQEQTRNQIDNSSSESRDN